MDVRWQGSPFGSRTFDFRFLQGIHALDIHLLLEDVGALGPNLKLEGEPSCSSFGLISRISALGGCPPAFGEVGRRVVRLKG